jgi:hypothetical protein
MAGFEVIESPVRTIWVPVDCPAGTGATVYVGQLVDCGFNSSSSGAEPHVVAGLGDITNDCNIFGVVVGTNNRTPLFNTTYKAEYTTGTSTIAQQLASERTGAGGMWGPSDPAAMVQVAVIGPETVLKGRIFHGAYGTAPDVVTNTTADATGATITTAAMDYATVAYNSIWYCRSGANMGLYRIGYGASTTSNTFYVRWPYGLAVGDTFCQVPLNIGTSKAFFDAVGTYIETNMDTNSYGTSYIWIDVLEVYLRDPGNEYAIFKLNPYSFGGKRA